MKTVIRTASPRTFLGETCSFVFNASAKQGRCSDSLVPPPWFMLRCQQFPHHCSAASVRMLTQQKRQMSSFYCENSFDLIDPPPPRRLSKPPLLQGVWNQPAQRATGPLLFPCLFFPRFLKTRWRSTAPGEDECVCISEQGKQSQSL